MHHSNSSLVTIMGFPGGSDSKGSAYNGGDLGSIPGVGRCPGGGDGSPLQYSCLENHMDGGAWWATVHRVAKSQTRLRDSTYLLNNDYGASTVAEWSRIHLPLQETEGRFHLWSGKRPCALDQLSPHIATTEPQLSSP